MKLYNKALNEREIGINFNASQDHIVTDGLISWWPMTGTGNYLKDSIHNNEGLIKGATWVNSAHHHYTTPGIYTVNLSVISDKGLKNYKTVELTIT